jgi:hypothetical protein
VLNNGDYTWAQNHAQTLDPVSKIVQGEKPNKV